eukprot:4675111-Pleurochrysis_carterae.AAC.2
MHSASMPRRDREAARPSVLPGGPEKRNRALREACAGDGSSVSCGGARGAGAGSVSAAVGSYTILRGWMAPQSRRGLERKIIWDDVHEAAGGPFQRKLD